MDWKRWGAAKKVWEAAKSDVSSPRPDKEPLPSDARYRDDLRALLVGMVSHVITLRGLVSTTA